MCLLLSKQSGITTRTYFSSWVLVLPAKDRFSFKVFNNITLCFSAKSVYILVKSKQTNTIHFYCLHKTQEIELQLCTFIRQCVPNNMQIRSEIVSKFSNALKFLSDNY